MRTQVENNMQKYDEIVQKDIRINVPKRRRKQCCSAHGTQIVASAFFQS